MNASEINSVIDNLCNKLGTTVDYLLPEIARYHQGKAIALLVIGILTFLMGFIIVLISKKQLAKEDNDDIIDEIMGVVITVGSFMTFGSIIITIVGISQLIIWFYAPEGAAIQSLLDSLR